jgi:hypothetical protein
MREQAQKNPAMTPEKQADELDDWVVQFALAAGCVI